MNWNGMLYINNPTLSMNRVCTMMQHKELYSRTAWRSANSLERHSKTSPRISITISQNNKNACKLATTHEWMHTSALKKLLREIYTSTLHKWRKNTRAMRIGSQQVESAKSTNVESQKNEFSLYSHPSKRSQRLEGTNSTSNEICFLLISI